MLDIVKMKPHQFRRFLYESWAVDRPPVEAGMVNGKHARHVMQVELDGAMQVLGVDQPHLVALLERGQLGLPRRDECGRMYWSQGQIDQAMAARPREGTANRQ
jgi:hypothetical protein